MTDNPVLLAATGGYDLNVLHKMHNEDGVPFLCMFVADAECDPIRIEYGPDGEITFPCIGMAYMMFEPDQLRFIASKSPQAEKVWERDFDPIEEAWE